MTRDRINNASFRQKLDPISKNILRRQNPLELVFEDISTFDAENPIVRALLRELDLKRKGNDSDIIKNLPSQSGKNFKIQKRLDRLKGKGPQPKHNSNNNDNNDGPPPPVRPISLSYLDPRSPPGPGFQPTPQLDPFQPQNRGRYDPPPPPLTSFKDSVNLKKIEERNKQFLIEKIIHGVEFKNPYANSIEQKPEIIDTVESNYKVIRRVYQHLYTDIADIFQKFIHSLPPQDIQDMDDDIKSNGWGGGEKYS